MHSILGFARDDSSAIMVCMHLNLYAPTLTLISKLFINFGLIGILGRHLELRHELEGIACRWPETDE